MHIHLLKLHSKVFSVGLSMQRPFPCDRKKAGSDCCKLALKTTEDDEEEVSASQAVAKDVSVDAAAASGLTVAAQGSSFSLRPSVREVCLLVTFSEFSPRRSVRFTVKLKRLHE